MAHFCLPRVIEVYLVLKGSRGRVFRKRSSENRSNIGYSETKHYKQSHTQTSELKNRLDFCNFSIRTLKARAIHPFTNETGHLFYLSVSNL